MVVTKQAAKKILKESGAVRVSESAALEFSEVVNKYAYALAKKAAKLANHAKRATVQKADVELAK